MDRDNTEPNSSGLAPALLPRGFHPYLCWSRMQAEAGQALEAIIMRKELERRAGGGTFFWGVGNAPARMVPKLARSGCHVDAIFSIMKSRPKTHDRRPRAILAWRGFVGVDGATQRLPNTVLVTSRAHSIKNAKHSHYALICYSDRPLALSDHGPFDPSAYRNVSEVGAQIGASQTTALITRWRDELLEQASYRINLRAKLTGAYWVKLVDSVELTKRAKSLLARSLTDASLNDWCDIVRLARREEGCRLPVCGQGRSFP